MMVRGRLPGALLLSLMILASLPVHSHHSAAMFDSETMLTLDGVVTRFDYVNPHSWLYVNVKNEDGSVTEWGFELDAPPRLRRIGISPKFWRAGDAVTVKTRPLLDGRPAGLLIGAVIEGGKTYGNVEGIANTQ